jgi:SAM-dependent methyltransferase
MDSLGYDLREIVPETVYGTHKRLRLLMQVLDEYRAKFALEPHNVYVLDVGCGTGALLTFPLALAGYCVVGIDIDERSVQLYANQRPQKASMIIGDVLCLAERRLFDVIICSEILEHLPDPGNVLVKSSRLLRPGGRLIVTLPNGNGGFEWEEILWNRFGFFVLDYVKQYYQAIRLRMRRRQFKHFFRRGLNKDLESSSVFNTLNHCPHVQFFTLDRITSLLNSVGLRVTQIYNLSFLSGKITHTLLGDMPFFVRWTTRIADRLPPPMCSNWFLVSEK